jgi:hypothetical protein
MIFIIENRNLLIENCYEIGSLQLLNRKSNIVFYFHDLTIIELVRLIWQFYIKKPVE